MAIARRARRPRRPRRERRPRRPRRLTGKSGSTFAAPRRPPKQRHPDAVERSYALALVRIAVEAQRLIRQVVLPELPRIQRLAGIEDSARRDALPWIGILAELFETVRARMARVIDPEFLERLTGNAAAETSDFNKEAMTAQLRRAIGVDIFLADPGLRRVVAGFVEANVALIKSIPEQFFDKVEKVIRDGFRKGQRAEQLAPKIARQFGVSGRRARFIARDQIAKINGQLTKQRQTELGVGEYIWRTSRDERVRASHRALEGTTHAWDDPPTTDDGRTVHPGEDFNCRCTAEPVIPGIEAIKTSTADVPRDPELVAAARRRRR